MSHVIATMKLYILHELDAIVRLTISYCFLDAHASELLFGVGEWRYLKLLALIGLVHLIIPLSKLFGFTTCLTHLNMLGSTSTVKWATMGVYIICLLGLGTSVTLFLQDRDLDCWDGFHKVTVAAPSQPTPVADFSTQGCNALHPPLGGKLDDIEYIGLASLFNDVDVATFERSSLPLFDNFDEFQESNKIGLFIERIIGVWEEKNGKYIDVESSESFYFNLVSGAVYIPPSDLVSCLDSTRKFLL